MEISKEEKVIKEYLSKITCRGCYNYCALDNPGCGRSKIWINEAIEKFKGEKNE